MFSRAGLQCDLHQEAHLQPQRERGPAEDDTTAKTPTARRERGAVTGPLEPKHDSHDGPGGRWGAAAREVDGEVGMKRKGLRQAVCLQLRTGASDIH